MASKIAKEVVHVKKGDGRYKQHPVLPDVAFLYVKKRKDWIRGTGFLVEMHGHCILLSAAHCLYDAKAGKVAERAQVFFGRKAKRDHISFEGDAIYVPHTYRPKGEKDFEQDCGFVYLGRFEDFLGHNCFELVHLSERKLREAHKIVITGYPSTVAIHGPEQFCQYSVELTHIECHPQRRFLTYKDATSGGMSGAPLYFYSDAGYFTVGIHVNEENGAVWLTPEVITSIKNTVLQITTGSRVTWQQNQLTTQLQGLHVQESEQPTVQVKLRRLQQDLGCPVFTGGDETARDPTFVSCPAMLFNRERVYERLAVSGDTELVNTESGGHHHTGQFKVYRGTCSLPIPLSPSPSTARYWETDTRLQVKKDVSKCDILEMGVTEEGQLDTDYLVSYQTRSSWTVYVGTCTVHPGICTRVRKENSQVGECQTVTKSRTPGTAVTLRYGVVVDVARGRLSFIDLDKEKILHKFDIEFTQTLFPMFGVWPCPDYFATKMRLVSGSDIAMTEKKKSLIFTALGT